LYNLKNIEFELRPWILIQQLPMRDCVKLLTPADPDSCWNVWL